MTKLSPAQVRALRAPHEARHQTLRALADRGLVVITTRDATHRVRAGRAFGAPYKTVATYVRDVTLTDAGRAALAAVGGDS